MTGYTPIYNLPYPQASDLVSAYPGTGQDLAEEVETVLAAKAPLASPALTGTPTVNGTAITALAGLVPMTPTSVTNGTASGAKISFTSQTTVTINGVFTSAYENYRLVVSTTEATRTSPIYARLCASGSAASGTDYCYYFVSANQSAGPSRSGANSATYMYLSETDAGASSANFMSFDIFGPQTTTRTRFTGSSMIGYANATTLFYATGGGNHILANSYDGISINCATAMTGTAYIYGYGK